MEIYRAVSVGLICGVLVLAADIGRGANRYFFEPETLRVDRGSSFEWHMMMENDVELCGYGFTIDALVGGEMILDPDTLTFDWTGTGADIGGMGFQVGPEFSSLENWFGGAATKAECPPGLDPGTYIAIRIYATISDTIGLGTTCAFSGPHSGSVCDFTDLEGSTFDVPVDTGWIQVGIPFIRADSDADMDVQMDDAIFTLRYIYVPDSPVPPCLDAADADDSGQVEMTDAVFTLEYLYVPESPSPPYPGPGTCGLDPTEDGLGCYSHPCAESGLEAAKETESVK